MSDFPIHSDVLPERIWRARHPLRKRVGKLRRAFTVLLMFLLWSIIFGYLYLTNEHRVRLMAADYLADLFGGQVSIQHADLSLFEGLTLEGVRVSVPDGNGPQSTLLEADSLGIHYNLADLLAGRLVATQIIVINPRVNLAEDTRSGRWNYQLLQARRTRPQVGLAVNALPEIVLRDARIDYLEITGDRADRAGWLALDGRFGPSTRPGENEFSFQSRGREALGPAIDGSFNPGTGHVQARLTNFVFGPDIQAMLPSQVRQWCREHALAGRMDVTMDSSLPSGATPPDFRVRADLQNVELSTAQHPGLAALALHDASGTLVFTNDGIAVSGVTARLENSRLAIDGSIGGYSPAAPFDLTIHSLGELNIPSPWPAVASLPQEFQEVYRRFLPRGRGMANVRVYRSNAIAQARCEARIDILDGGFTFNEVPYPISHATGQILLGPDAQLGFDVVKLNIRGAGIDGGPNQNARLTVNGWIGPFGPTCGGHVDVHGDNVHAEPALIAALEAPARSSLALLDGAKDGNPLAFNVSFDARADCPDAGRKVGVPWNTDTDLTVVDADATYSGFAYPLHKAAGKIEIRTGYVNVIGLSAHHDAATILLNGRINFDHDGKNLTPDLEITAKDMAIDDALRNALGAEPRQWLQKIGAAGNLDVAGRVSGPDARYDLNLILRDGALSPRGTVAVGNLAGRIHLTPDRIEFTDITGRRGNSAISGQGEVELNTTPRLISLAAQADNLALDQAVYDLLPAEGRVPWDYLHPSGAIDATFAYDNHDAQSPLELTIRPRDLTVSPVLSPSAPPLRLDHVNGSVTWLPDQEARWDVSAQRGAGKFRLIGSWSLSNPASPWDLRLSGANVSVEPELVKSLPDGIAQVMAALSLSGNLTFAFSKLSYRPVPAADASAGSPPIPSAPADIDFAVKVDCAGAAMNIGVPLSELQGTAVLSGSVRDGRLHDLSGDLSADSLRIAGRAAHDLQAKLTKPADRAIIQVTGLRAVVAGGDVAADLSVGIPDSGDGRYALNLILSGADVRELSGLADDKLSGRISASLQLSGSVTDPNARQGTGDVRVFGAQMYQIPLLLGLFQVTNLAVPISAPFEQALAHYSVQGQRVTLEKIQLSNKDMTMQGTGHIDFGAGTVELTFDTDNPKWLSIPVVGPIWNRAQNELLRIHVKGSIKSPKVSASSLDTFTTTVDQVLKGDKGK